MGKSNNGESAQLRIDDPHLFKSREELVSRVARWRDLYPWLKGWRLTEASHAWDNSVLLFYSIAKSNVDEFSEQRLVAGDNGFAANLRAEKFVPFETIPLAGGISKNAPYSNPTAEWGDSIGAFFAVLWRVFT
ncbi:hypothetical protein [Bradyrhizobium retamae]|uniref:hypothetical protein n=1 Tax=Bradyrhizobium retamae TaxID=1300035 RepID=UPI0012E3832A|nr:hypothetical protein [Bradyrhizobium retamae]